MVEMQGTSPQEALQAVTQNMLCAELREIDRQDLIEYIKSLGSTPR